MRLMKRSVPRVEQLEDRCLMSANVVLEWNQLALHAIGQARLSPVFVSRDLAITQAAVYDAVVAIDRSFELYHAHVHASRGASPEAAAAQAAHDTLTALFPTQAATFDAALAADLVGIPPGRASQGVEVGREAAQQILAWRSTDGSTAVVPYTPGTDPGDWQPTPPANLPALAPQWPDVTPFAMTGGSEFRPEAPPALDSAEYAAAFKEVKDLGRVDSLTRTDEQTQIAKFWNDGLGTAFAMGYWNRIAQQVATDQGLSLDQDARLFALLNIAEADAQIACWDAKYTYNLWRPVTAIRAADTDGNPDTDPDATWTPLLTTPNFPSYTSAHSTLSAAAAGVLTALFGSDYHFSVGSESLPGVTRSFDSFGAAAREAGRSRIYGGIHYTFDNVNGQSVGGKVADFVVGNFLTPRSDGDDDWLQAAAAPRTLSDTLDVNQVQPLVTEVLPSAPATDVTSGHRGDEVRMDLLIALDRESGHLLGHGHDHEGATQENMTAGTRRTDVHRIDVALTGLEKTSWFDVGVGKN